jgi:hypothetical protein
MRARSGQRRDGSRDRRPWAGALGERGKVLREGSALSCGLRQLLGPIRGVGVANESNAKQARQAGSCEGACSEANVGC